MSWTVSVTIEDEKGAKSTHKVYLPDAPAWTTAQVIAFVDAYQATLAPLITGAIVRIALLYPVPLPVSLDRAPTPESDVEEYLQVIMSAGWKNKPRFRLATWRDDYLFLASSQAEERSVKWWLPEVQAWDNLVQAAPTLGFPANPCDKRGERWEAIRERYQRFRD